MPNTPSLISFFPIEHYDQTLETWLNPNAPDYDQSLISATKQQARLQEFYRHYFDSSSTGLSPWSEAYITQVLSAAPPNNIHSVAALILADFSNQDKTPDEIGYGINFRPYASAWIEAIRNNINLDQFAPPLSFTPNNLGISLTNLDARALPTSDPHFYNYRLAGQGYPFDNLQICSLWAGTPVYVIGTTQDREWALVLTPNLIAWVKYEGIGHVDKNFIQEWQTKAQMQLAAITETHTPIIDHNGIFRFSAYVGSVFPVEYQSNEAYTLLIPISDRNRQTIITTTTVNANQAAIMPLSLTPHYFARIIRSLMGRAYGWGGLYFYNDCSQEIKSLYTPFAIWLPHHSSEQASAGTVVDMSGASVQERINYLSQNGHKLTTLVHVGGHVFIYIGNYPNPNAPKSIMAQTYQNVWGLSPADNSRRSIIGGAVFLPLLNEYSEDPSLVSWANKKYFQVSYLDQMPASLTIPPLNVKALMMPDSIAF